MAYMDGFIVEYVGNHSTSCSNCIYFQSDKSCDKNGEYIPAISYDYYKQCYHFQRTSEKECADDRKKRIEREKSEKKKADMVKKAPTGSKKKTASFKGRTVFHADYGQGIVISEQDGTIGVRFENRKVKLFAVRIAFEKGTLSLSDPQQKQSPVSKKTAAKQKQRKPARSDKAKSSNTAWNGGRIRTYVDSPEDPKDDEMPIKKTCSNCAYSRNSEHCSQFAVCDEWRFGKPSQSYWPTIEDERRRQLNDIRKRDR